MDGFDELTTEYVLAEMLESVARLLVDDEREVTVESRCEDGLVVLQLTTAPADTGKVIGKQGRTARSLRTILNAAGVKMGTRVELAITEFPEEKR